MADWLRVDSELYWLLWWCCMKGGNEMTEKELKEFEDKAKKFFENSIDFYAYLAEQCEKDDDARAAAIYREKMSYFAYALNRVGALPVEEEGSK